MTKRSFGEKYKSISQQSLKELEVYPWPGNVRELEHVLERSIILSTGSMLKVQLDKKLTLSVESNGDFNVKTLKGIRKRTYSEYIKNLQWKNPW